MSAELLSDIAFLEKLENVAGVTNDHLLSDQEILRGRALLLKVQEKLRVPRIDAEEERRLTTHISLLSIAVAPHKGIPQDVLRQIFLAYNSTMNTNHSLGQGPWRLGQVCRAWRELSHSMPDLWGTTVLAFDNTDSDILKIGLDILPRIAATYVRADSNHRTELVPNLCRVDNLDLCVRNGDDQELWDMLPTHAFSRIISLELTNFRRSGRETHTLLAKKLFGLNPRLKTLSLISHTPDILCCDDVPWDQIIDLNLNNRFQRRGQSGDLGLWTELRARQTFSPHARLRHLNLHMTDDLLPLIFSWHIPWRQLCEFNASFASQLHVPTTVKELQQCTSLVDLVLSTSDMAYYGREEACIDLILPALQNLMFRMWNPNILLRSLTAPLLTHLDMKSETLKLADIIQFITRSQCKLNFFSLLLFSDRSQFDASTMTQLLSSLAWCTSFTLEKGVMPDPILDDISTLTLLPCVETIKISFMSLDTLFSFAEGRLENQTASGRNSLRAIHALIPGLTRDYIPPVSSAQQDRWDTLRQRTPTIYLHVNSAV